MQQLKSGFKRTINWNKYKSKATVQTQNQYLHYLIDPRFPGVNRFFVLLSENNDDGTGHTGYFLLNEQIKVYNVMIDGNFLLIN